MSVWGSKKDTIARLTAVSDTPATSKKKAKKSQTLRLVFTEKAVINADDAQSAVSELRKLKQQQQKIDDESKYDTTEDTDLKTDKHSEIDISDDCNKNNDNDEDNSPHPSDSSFSHKIHSSEEDTKQASDLIIASKSDDDSSKTKPNESTTLSKKTTTKKKKSKVMGHSGSRYSEVISVILDSGVFITRCNVANYFDPAHTRFLITENVRREVNDARSTEFLTSFPFPLETVSPNKECQKKVNEWIKILPEYNRTLSRTDRELIALTLEHTLNDPKSKDYVKDVHEFAQNMKATRERAMKQMGGGKGGKGDSSLEMMKRRIQKKKKEEESPKRTCKFGVSHLDAWDGEWATPDNYRSITESGVDRKRKRLIKETMRSISDILPQSSEMEDASKNNHDGSDEEKKNSRVVCITVDLRMQQLMKDMGLRIMSVSSDRLSKMSDSMSRGYKSGEVLIEQMIECQICKHKYSDMNMSRVYCTANCGCDELWIIKKYLQYESGRIRIYKRKLHSARTMKQMERRKEFEQRQRRKIFGKQRHKKHTSTARGVGPARKRSNKLKTAGAGKRETLAHDLYPKRGL